MWKKPIGKSLSIFIKWIPCFFLMLIRSSKSPPETKRLLFFTLARLSGYVLYPGQVILLFNLLYFLPPGTLPLFWHDLIKIFSIASVLSYNFFGIRNTGLSKTILLFETKPLELFDALLSTFILITLAWFQSDESTSYTFILAGVLKGATGAGAPIITIPVISAFYDVRLAVVLMVVPNFLSNIQQLYYFRKSILPLFATFSFALGGGGGAFLGTIFLANLSLDILSFGVGIIVIIFISFKFFVPTWKLEYKKSKNLFFPFGFFGGIFQGAAGISAPISITFLNSFKLDRKTFIPTISVYFMMMSAFQAPALIHYKFMNFEIFVISLICTGILIISMPIGNKIAKSVSVELFDKLILILLGFISLKIFFDFGIKFYL